MSNNMLGRDWPLSDTVIAYIATVGKTDLPAAARELQTEMLDGNIKARGPLGVIESEYWRFALPRPGGGATNIAQLHELPWFEVCAADVLAIWPGRDPTKAAPPGPKPGERTGKQRACELTSAILADEQRRPRRRHGRLTEIARMVAEDLRREGLNYAAQSVEKVIRPTLKEWEAKNPDT
jgi:hypothetical protein